MSKELSEDEKAKIRELKQKHGNIGYIRVRGNLIAVRAPTLAEGQRYQDALTASFTPKIKGRGGGSLSECKRTFALDCTVLPETRDKARETMDPIGFAVYDRLVDKIEALAELDIEDFEGN